MSVGLGLKPLVACCALFAFSQVLPAQAAAPAHSAGVASAGLRVAVVDLQRAVFQTAEIQKADKDMQAKYTPRQQQLASLQKEIADIANQLQNNGNKMTPQQAADLQAEGQQKQRDAQRMQQDLQDDTTSDRNEILSKSTQKMTDVVKKLAEEKGIDVVVDSRTILYFKPTMDLTNDAIAAYDKAYPAK